jgi:predicted molibdopterin-dependent oxidoreductase YjgC
MKLARDVVGTKFNWDWLGVVWMSLIRKGYSTEEAITVLTELQTTGFAKIDKGNIDKEYKLNFNFPKEFFELDENRLSCSGYDFTLACGFRRDKIINNVFTDGRKWVEIYTTDADKLGLVSGDLVQVTTPVGSMDLKCSVTDKTQPGYLRIPFFKEINTITDAGKIGERELNPSYKHQFANIKKL